jgi:hypothetical protein
MNNGTEKKEEKDFRYIQKASAPAAEPCIRPVTQYSRQFRTRVHDGKG